MLEILVGAFGILELSAWILPKFSLVSKHYYFVGRSDDRRRLGRQDKKKLKNNVKSIFS